MTDFTRPTSDGAGADPTASVRKAWLARLRRVGRMAYTRAVWGRRLHSLGKRSTLGRATLVRNPRVIAIGERVTVESGFVFADLRCGYGSLPKIRIGDGCTILFRFQCNAAECVTIGENVLIASNVLITDSDHVVEPNGDPTTRSTKLITRPVSIGHDCWLGQNAVILKGVTIGHHCIVGANTVVTRDVPDCSIVVGNPGRVIKQIGERAAVDSKQRSPNESSDLMEALACT